MVEQTDYNVRIVVKNGIPKLGHVTMLQNKITVDSDGDRVRKWVKGNRRKLARMLKIDLW